MADFTREFTAQQLGLLLTYLRVMQTLYEAEWGPEEHNLHFGLVRACLGNRADHPSFAAIYRSLPPDIDSEKPVW